MTQCETRDPGSQPASLPRLENKDDKRTYGIVSVFVRMILCEKCIKRS